MANRKVEEGPGYVYKIRRIADGKWSTGGRQPNWTLSGKSWTLGSLRAHLALFLDLDDKKGYPVTYDYPYKDCEVIKVKVIYEASDVIPVDNEIGLMRLRRIQESEKRRLGLKAPPGPYGRRRLC